MGPDERLTIVLPLKDRPQFTWRWMRYAEYIGLPFKVIIADGGKDGMVPDVLGNHENFPKVNYQYIRYPYDQTYTQYYAKMLDALSQVETPLVALADNDDFFLIDGLRQSVEFLSDNADYSSCRGIIGGVKIKPNARYRELNRVYGSRKEILFAAQIYPPGSTLDETAARRVEQQFSRYRTNWYDVFRIEQARANVQAMKELDIKDLILAQHVFHLLGNVAGKIHRDSYPYLVRQMESPGSSDQVEIKGKGDHFDRMLLETWSRDFAAFLQCIAHAISHKDGISLESSLSLVKQGYRNFMAPAVMECLTDQVCDPRLVRFTRSVYPAFRNLYLTIKGPSGAIGHYRAGSELAATNKDFKLIYTFLSSALTDAQ